MSKQFTTDNLQHTTILDYGTKFMAREIDAFGAAKRAANAPASSQRVWVHRESELGSMPLAYFVGRNAKVHADSFAVRQNAAYAPHGFYRAVVTVR